MNLKSHPLRVRELKLRSYINDYNDFVSHPLRVRELKLRMPDIDDEIPVAPFTGA